MKREQLEKIVEKMNADNASCNIMGYIVGPVHPARRYELQKMYNKEWGVFHQYQEEPGEVLIIYAVAVSYSVEGGDPAFNFIEVFP